MRDVSVARIVIPTQGLRSFFIALVIVIAFLSSSEDALADSYPDIPYVVADLESGEVLKANRIDQRWYPASLTKLMTAYVVFRAIETGEIDPGSPVTVTAAATREPGSRMGYREGVVLRFDTALMILMVRSANDVAVAIAQSLAGTVPAFVQRMNAEAQRLGMSDTKFVNPHGLHNSAQFTSPRDMAILARDIMGRYPQYADLFDTPTIVSGDRRYTSYNLLLERFAGTTGMKTGFVCASGYNIVASARRDGRHLVAVVMGADSQTQRAELSARLLLDGFKVTAIDARLDADGRRSAAPLDMRSTICTEAARQARYDPNSDSAVLDSPYLYKRRITREPFPITFGNIDGDPSPAWLARAFTPDRVPLPIKRPDYQVVGVDGDALSSDDLLRGTIPVPEQNPRIGGSSVQ